MRIFLIRHGFSEGNENLDNYALRGDSNIELTRAGWEQAAGAGAFLQRYLTANPSGSSRSPRLWVSPYKRTRQTASGLLHGMGENGLITEPARIQEALIEQDFGLYSHLHDEKSRKAFSPLISEFVDKARAREKFFARFPLGESPYDVQRRIKPFFETIFRDKEKGVEDCVCVTHGVTLRAFAMAFLHIDPAAYEDFPNPPNGGVYVIEDTKQGRYSLRQIYDGQSGKEVDIDWGAALDAGKTTLPEVPYFLKRAP
jgi:broad specificity phosphatase PhoE